MEVKAPSTKKGMKSLLGKINFLRRFISNLSGRTHAFPPLLRLNKEGFEWGHAQQEAFNKIKAYLSHPPILTPPCRNKSMRLYIFASDKTLGSMLAQEEDNGVERAIYYLSRVLSDAETRYSMIEKLCLYLYFSCTKLKHYIKPVDGYVSSHYDVIKHMLSKPILHSLIGKRALALTEFSLTYMPLRDVIGQVVADFIVDHSIDANALNYVELGPWKLYFNGSSHKDGHEMLLELGATRVEIMGDSELVIKQTTKEYRFIKENLIMYFIVDSRPLKRFEMVSIRHMPRLENQVANDLAQIASGYKISKENLHKVIEVRGKVVATGLMPLDLEKTKLEYAGERNFEIFAIDNLTDENWRKPIVVYLQNPTASTDQKTRYRASSYVLLGTKLFKKSSEVIFLKCLSDSEVYFALSTVDSGACGAHQVGHKMKWLLFCQGMYWPTMLKDCIEFEKGCQECQMHAGIQQVHTSELHSIINPWPFRGWALDLIGEFRHPSSSK
ncbi:uncharacterized protein LOC127096059 [Lathyrus oleraceus]|uniref:uncharacterized protein LOC127096059 n=1 Tax=Pisum sativum TaxID=3888 RepID=UPI0021CE08CF|nr:uncharacterized protein LOC127096059 [Pisum sativum]